MSEYRAIDLSILPFTHEMKAGPYSSIDDLKNSLLHLGVWDDSFSASELVAKMDEAGVNKGLLPAQEAGVWSVGFEVISALHDAYPTRLYGNVGIDPRKIVAGLKRLETGVRELGYVGAHSYPHWFGLSPDDRVYYPFYAKCAELGVPVQIQVGQAYQHGLISVGRPSAIDAIAVHFPELTIIGIHTGYPWEREMVSVSWKHENVYIGADTHHPRTWVPDLVEYIKGDGREKVMWGTNFPCLQFDDALAGVNALGLEEDVKRLLLYENAKRVYRL